MKPTTYTKDDLIDAVLEQMNREFCEGDLTAIQALLSFVPLENLFAYMPEAYMNEHNDDFANLEENEATIR